jgi:hypothetical protein
VLDGEQRHQEKIDDEGLRDGRFLAGIDRFRDGKAADEADGLDNRY